MRLGGGLHLEMEVVRRDPIESRDPGSAPRLQRRPHRLGPGLRIHLSFSLNHLAVESAIEVRILPGGMVMVAQGRGTVTVEGIQRSHRGPIRFGEAVNPIAVKGDGDGLPQTHPLLQVSGSDVVMIIVGAAAVSAEFVEFAGQEGVGATVVLDRIENRHAVDRHRDGPAKEMVFGRQRLRGRHRKPRNPPRIVTHIGLRQGHLLLPGGDANHHAMIGHAIALHDPVGGIGGGPHLRSESAEQTKALGRCIRHLER